MSRILKVSNGDYRLQVQSGGVITLDTGSNVGTVVITGNLDIKGMTTTVESTNTRVQDNILQLNYGQTGNGISNVLNYESGIEIERGDYYAAQLLYSESVTHYDPLTATTVPGTWVLRTKDGALSGLQVNSITNDGTADFTIDLRGSINAVSIVNSGGISGVGGHTQLTDAITYAASNLQPYHIPNVQYLNTYVTAHAGVAAVDRLYAPVAGMFDDASSSIQAIGSLIYMKVGGATMATISTGGVSINYLSFVNSIISTNDPAFDLILTADSNNVVISSMMNLSDQSPSNVSTYGYTVGGKTKIYSQAIAGPGQTGLFFTNVNATDELVAKNRALLFSMLF